MSSGHGGLCGALVWSHGRPRVGLPGPHAEAKACVLGCPCVSWPMRFTWTSSWDGVCRVSPPPAVRLLLRLLSRETCEAMPVSWLLVLGRGGPVTCRWMSAATMVTLAPIWQTLVLSAVQVSWRSAGRAPPRQGCWAVCCCQPPGLLDFGRARHCLLPHVSCGAGHCHVCSGSCVPVSPFGALSPS